MDKNVDRLAKSLEQLLERVEYPHAIFGSREGHMCLHCYQFKPRAFPKGTSKATKAMHGHKPECPIGGLVLEIKGALASVGVKAQS